MFTLKEGNDNANQHMKLFDELVYTVTIERLHAFQRDSNCKDTHNAEASRSKEDS
jgi:hypothetical protein